MVDPPARDERGARGPHAGHNAQAAVVRALTGLQLYAWLDRHRSFRPVVLTLMAAVVGLLLTPDLAVHDMPAGPAREGMPAVGNLKAPYDLEVVDEEATERLREEAVGRVRRIYDQDTGLAARAEQRIAAAFAGARAALAVVPGPRPVSAADAARAALEAGLGVAVAPEEAAALAAVHFASEAEAALTRLVRAELAVPIAPTRAGLAADRGHGVVLHRDAPPDADDAIEPAEAISDLEAARHELTARGHSLLPDQPPAVRLVLVALAARMLEPTLALNRGATEMQRADARLSVRPVTISVKKGEMVVRDGERLSRRHLLVFDVLRRQGHKASFVLAAAGGALLALVLVATTARFAGGTRLRRVTLAARDVLLLVATLVLSLGSAKVWLNMAHVLHENDPSLPLDTLIFLLPTAASAMVVRLVLRAEVALLFALVASLLTGLLAESDRMIGLYTLVGQVAAIASIRTISARSDLLKAGLWVGLFQALAALGIQLFDGSTLWQGYLLATGAAFVGGALTGFVALSLTPLVEWLFRYTTDLRLLELSNLNHPALKELIVQAPGSYHHSIIVGALVEAAAESINANPLLARVMAYYHDLGKGCNPGYFVENQRGGHNPHDKLKPSMSAMVIRRHVTDGLELARRYGLGEQILAGIAQHHGTTLIQFFYHRAREQAEVPDSVSEAEYRYPGQKPQSREAALVMLGDSIEAAARSLPDPTAARLQGLVNRIINHKFTDGQLEECDLTLRDLHTIAKSFSRVLGSIYHHRLEYPEPPKDSGRKDRGDDGVTRDNLRRLGL